MKTLYDAAGKRRCTIFQNKCCIACLVIIGLLIMAVIGAKIFIDDILSGADGENFHESLSGLNDANENSTFAEPHFLETWVAPDDIRHEIVHTFTGLDFQQRPVWILPVGKWNLRGLLNAKPENEELMKTYADQCLYRILKSLKDYNSTQWVLIADMHNFRYTQLASLNTITFIVRTIKRYEQLFSTMGYGWTINLDYFSQGIVTVVRPVLGTHLDRLEFTGLDRDTYVTSILRKVAADQLPPEYGGSKGHRPIAHYE